MAHIKLIVLCATVAFANAGHLLGPTALTYSAGPSFTYGAPLSYSAPAITSQSQNIYRSAGNLGQISTYSKSIDTPFSSVRKADVRISNPGFKYATGPAVAAYAAPAAYATHATYAAPATYTTHGTYAAPAAYTAHGTYAAPAAYTTAHATYSAPAAYTAPTAYAAHTPLLGVAYSAAPAVAHVAFDSGVAHYAW